MAKIGKTHTTVNNQFTVLEVHYNQSRGFFHKGLPHEVYELTELGKTKHLSEKDLGIALYCALEEYHEKTKKQRKVILFELLGSSELINNKTESVNGTMYSGTKNGVSDKFASSRGNGEYSFGFTHHILLETVAKNKEYHCIDKDDNITRRYQRDMNERGINIIDWTPEREQFFLELKEQLFNLIVGVSTFFDNPEYLKLMDTGGLKALNQ